MLVTALKDGAMTDRSMRALLVTKLVQLRHLLVFLCSFVDQHSLRKDFLL